MPWRKASGTAFVTALPTSPVDGQEVYYQADGTNGVIWHLRYRAASSSANKWEFVGGSALGVTNTNLGALAIGTTPIELTGQRVVLPLAGTYVLSANAAALAATIQHTLRINGVDVSGLVATMDETWDQMSASVIATAATAGLVAAHYVNAPVGSYTPTYYGCSFFAIPIRV